MLVKVQFLKGFVCENVEEIMWAVRVDWQWNWMVCGSSIAIIGC